MVDRAALPNQTEESRYDWRTPPDLFALISRELGPFTLDAAADAENRLAPRWFDEATNGLAQPWGRHRVWCNPPYGRALPEWADKFGRACAAGAFVAALITASTSERWFLDRVVNQADEVRLLVGRVPFVASPGRELAGRSSNRYPNALALYRPDRWAMPNRPPARVWFWDWKAELGALRAEGLR